MAGFAVDEEDLLQRGNEGLHPVQEFALVGVPAEFVDLGDFGAEAHGFAEDGDFFLFVEDLAAEGVLGLEAGDQDGVAWIADGVAEVVDDAAGFGHAAGGDDHHGAAEIV